LFALLWFAVRLILHTTDWVEDELTISVMVNLFFLVMLIYKAIRDAHNPSLPFIEVAKAGMRQASLYAFVVAVLIFVFYQFIDTDFVSENVDRYQQAQVEGLEEIGGWEKVKAENPAIGDQSMEEYLDEQRTTAIELFSPWFIASTSLFVMVFGGLIYSFIATFFHRKLLSTLKK